MEKLSTKNLIIPVVLVQYACNKGKQSHDASSHNKSRVRNMANSALLALEETGRLDGYNILV